MPTSLSFFFVDAMRGRTVHDWTVAYAWPDIWLGISWYEPVITKETTREQLRQLAMNDKQHARGKSPV